MCGGVGFKIKNIPEEELRKFYSADQVKRMKKENHAESFFWDKTPVMPVKDENKEKLVEWGNRDEENKLPQTGWAKQESIDKGRWKWLHPKNVDIPAESGYEKKVWFGLPDGLKGLLVNDKEGHERVYMITKEASKKYKDKTGHDREPIGRKENYQKGISTI